MILCLQKRPFLRLFIKYKEINLTKKPFFAVLRFNLANTLLKTTKIKQQKSRGREPSANNLCKLFSFFI